MLESHTLGLSEFDIHLLQQPFLQGVFSPDRNPNALGDFDEFGTFKILDGSLIDFPAPFESYFTFSGWNFWSETLLHYPFIKCKLQLTHQLDYPLRVVSDENQIGSLIRIQSLRFINPSTSGIKLVDESGYLQDAEPTPFSSNFKVQIDPYHRGKKVMYLDLSKTGIGSMPGTFEAILDGVIINGDTKEILAAGRKENAYPLPACN